MQSQEWDDWEEVVRKDMKLSGLMADLLLDPNAHTHYEIRKGDYTIMVSWCCLKVLPGFLLLLRSYIYWVDIVDIFVLLKEC